VFSRLRSAVLWLIVSVGIASGSAHAQEVPLDYRLKAAYLLNFIKFVEWPPATGSGPFTMCIARHNPFGEVLAATLGGETGDGRPIHVRIIATPEPGCDVLFVPQDAPATPFLRAARGSPTLTVGESPRFTAQGGVINFVRQEGTVRFQINPGEAERAGLRISSHLLRLARFSDR
jgi:hypothetical protein